MYFGSFYKLLKHKNEREFTFSANGNMAVEFGR